MRADPFNRYRHQCEVRLVLSKREAGRSISEAYLERVAKARGQKAAEAIKADAAEQWGKGNRGNHGDWL